MARCWNRAALPVADAPLLGSLCETDGELDEVDASGSAEVLVGRAEAVNRLAWMTLEMDT